MEAMLLLAAVYRLRWLHCKTLRTGGHRWGHDCCYQFSWGIQGLRNFISRACRLSLLVRIFISAPSASARV